MLHSGTWLIGEMVQCGKWALGICGTRDSGHWLYVTVGKMVSGKIVIGDVGY